MMGSSAHSRAETLTHGPAAGVEPPAAWGRASQGCYFTCTSDVNRIPFVSGLKIKATTATTAPMIVP